jgi:hypothetical protein
LGKKESLTKIVQPNEFVSVPYKRILLNSSLIPLVQINVSITLTEEGEIETYFLNETQYLLLKNDTGFSSDIEKLRVNLNTISFEPVSNVTYYIVMTNIENDTVNVSIYTSEFYTCQVFDFTNAFNGLNLALIGGAVFVTSFVFGNLFDKLICRGLSSPIFPGVERYKEEENINIAWAVLGILTLAIIVFELPTLNEISATIHTYRVPPFLIPLVQDSIIRYGIFGFFVGILIFVLFIVVGYFGSHVSANFLYWLFDVRYGRHSQNRLKWRSRGFELQKKSQELWLKELKSPLSLLFYAVIAIVSYGLYNYTDDFFILLISILVPLTILLAYNSSVSHRKVCRDNEELKKMNFFDYVNIVATASAGILFLLLIFFSFDLLANELYTKTVGSSVLILLAPEFSDIFLVSLSTTVGYIRTIQSGVIILFQVVIIGALSFSLFSTYFLHSLEKREAKKNLLFKEITIFLLTFFSVQLALLSVKQNLEVATFTSMILALISSFLGFFMRISWKNIIVAPRLCPHCGKDLSSSSEDISYCSYCGKELSSEQK